MAKEFRQRRGDLAFAPATFISALTGQRAVKVLDLVDLAYANWRQRIRPVKSIAGLKLP